MKSSGGLQRLLEGKGVTSLDEHLIITSRTRSNFGQPLYINLWKQGFGEKISFFTYVKSPGSLIFTKVFQAHEDYDFKPVLNLVFEKKFSYRFKTFPVVFLIMIYFDSHNRSFMSLII